MSMQSHNMLNNKLEVKYNVVVVYHKVYVPDKVCVFTISSSQEIYHIGINRSPMMYRRTRSSVSGLRTTILFAPLLAAAM